MEEFLNDKIFQFYFKKIYGSKLNYQTFKSFSDKDKVSFLINLYLFINNTNQNNNNLLKNNENEENYIVGKEKDIFYENNYLKIMNEYNNILNKYNNKFYSKSINNNNEINKDQLKIINSNKNAEKTKSYINQNKEYKVNVDTDNYFEEKKIKEENEIVIISKKNDIDMNKEKKSYLKYYKNNHIINTEPKMHKSKNVVEEEFFQKQPKKVINSDKENNENPDNKVTTSNNNIEDNKLELSARSYDNLNNLNKNKIYQSVINIDNTNNNLINYKNPNNKIHSINSRNLVENKTQSKKDIILTEQTITEKSLIHLEEFTNDNLVEKLIKCPQNKYISLNCSEANQVALVIINLMESKNELEIEIEEERKKNEIKLDKLKLDFEKQKNEIKALYDKKGNNVINVLSELKKEINEEKIFLEEEEKGYNLWDHVTIENQKTKEIRAKINKMLDGFKK